MITTIINYVHDPIDKIITLSDFSSITLEQFIAIRNLTRDVYIYKLTDTTNFGGSVFGNSITYTVNSESFSSDDIILIQYDDFKLDSVSADGGSSSVTGTVTTDGTLKITDGTNIAAVKASYTPPLSSDPALVVTLSPNSQFSFTGTLDSNVNINAGTNLIGKVGIDQTTPGTTNKVTVGSDVVHVIVDSGAGAGTQYADGVVRGTATGTLMMGDDGTNIQSVKVSATGVLSVDGSASTQPVSDGGGSLTVDGSVNAVQSGTWNIGAITTLPPLVAGTAIIGKVGIDQTTPGTTNKVTIGSDVVHVIVDSGVTTGLTDAQLRASAVPVSISTVPLATDAATENSLVLLRRITKLLESLSIVDSGQRQRIVLDAISASLTLATITTVANNTAIAGMDREMYINIARSTFANCIRSRLAFS